MTLPNSGSAADDCTRRLRHWVWLTTALGALLHTYAMVFKADGPWNGFLFGLLAFSLSPYAVGWVLSRFSATLAWAPGYGLAALVGDVYMHYAVFIAPKGSTAALGLLFMPLWNLVLLGPLGALAGWGYWRFRRRSCGAGAH